MNITDKETNIKYNELSLKGLVTEYLIIKYYSKSDYIFDGYKYQIVIDFKLINLIVEYFHKNFNYSFYRFLRNIKYSVYEFIYLLIKDTDIEKVRKAEG